MGDYERALGAEGSLETLLAQFLALNRTASPLDPNQALRPVFMKVRAYCSWRGVGETKAWEEIKNGQLEIVRDGRNVLVTYRSALKRALELAAETLEPPERRAALQRTLEQASPNFESVA
jgi:hypothetical protein